MTLSRAALELGHTHKVGPRQICNPALWGCLRSSQARRGGWTTEMRGLQAGESTAVSAHCPIFYSSPSGNLSGCPTMGNALRCRKRHFCVTFIQVCHSLTLSSNCCHVGFVNEVARRDAARFAPHIHIRQSACVLSAAEGPDSGKSTIEPAGDSSTVM